MATIEITIKGKVQGVFYRASAKKIAEQFRLNGYVKNLPNGDVQAVVAGSDEAIAGFVEWCKRGPSHAIVESVETKAASGQHYTKFEIVR